MVCFMVSELTEEILIIFQLCYMVAKGIVDGFDGPYEDHSMVSKVPYIVHCLVSMFGQLSVCNPGF